MPRENRPSLSDELIYSNPVVDPPKLMPMNQSEAAIGSIQQGQRVSTHDQGVILAGKFLSELEEEHLPEAEIVDESSLVTRFDTQSIDVDLNETSPEPDFEVTEEALIEKKVWIMVGIVRKYRKIEGGLMAMVQVSSIEKNKAANLRLAHDTPKKEVVMEGRHDTLKNPKDGLYLVLGTRGSGLKILGGFEKADKVKQSVVRSAFDSIQTVRDFELEDSKAMKQSEK